MVNLTDLKMLMAMPIYLVSKMDFQTLNQIPKGWHFPKDLPTWIPT